MPRTTRRTGALLAGLAALAPACLSPAEPPPIHYYGATIPTVAVEAGEPATRLLWVRRVSAAEHLKQRFVWRSSDVEYGFRELARWTEEPAVFVRRSLECRLFPSTFLRNETSRAMTVEVVLHAFEEKLEPQRSARVAFLVLLRDPEGGILLERVFEHETPMDDPGDGATARAMSRSMGAATADAAQAIDQAARGVGAGTAAPR